MSLLELLLVKEDSQRHRLMHTVDGAPITKNCNQMVEILTQADNSSVITENFTIPIFMRESI